jgi:hypothetical protein
MDIHIPQVKRAIVRREGRRIVLLMNGQVVADLPWDAALEFGKGIITKARDIEEEVKAEQIIPDEALLNRLGVPISLTNNPDIKKEAFKAAQYDPFLRRAITGARAKGIPSAESVGRPGLIKHPPKGGDNGREKL